MSPTLKTENMQILPKMQTPQPTWWPRLPTGSAKSCTRSWERGAGRTWSSPRSACPPSWPWSRLEPRVLPLKRFQISIFVETPLKNKMPPNNRDLRLDNGPRCIWNFTSNQLYVSIKMCHPCPKLHLNTYTLLAREPTAWGLEKPYDLIPQIIFLGL